MQSLSYSVPATPMQGSDTQPASARMQQHDVDEQMAFDRMSHSVPTTPYETKVAASPLKTDPASIQALIQQVDAERSHMVQLQASIQQLSSPKKGTPQQSPSLPPRPSPQQQAAAHSTTPSMHGRPLVSFSPSPPPPSSNVPPTSHGKKPADMPNNGGKTWPPRASPSTSGGKLAITAPVRPIAPLPPFTPSTSFLGGTQTTPLSVIEERSPAIQNLNDSFASVASDVYLDSPAGGPFSLSGASPGSLPGSPTMLKEVIRTQRGELALAGQFGSDLFSEVEALNSTNNSLRAQLADMAEAAASAHVVAALEDFVRAEIQATSNDRGSLGSPIQAQTYQLTGQLSADFSTFQVLLRTQRKNDRERRSNLLEELEEVHHTNAQLSASVQSLQAAQAKWATFQQQHNALQQEHDEKEITCEELQTKLKLQASQHASMLQLLQDQLAAAKDDARAEVSKAKEAEKQRRNALEEQITQLRAQLSRATVSDASVSRDGGVVGAHGASSKPMGLDLVITSPSGSSHPVISTTSLADDLASASESPRVGASSISSDMPTIVVDSISPSGVLTSFQMGRLQSQFDTMLATETSRKAERESWHQTESLWFFERARAREVEAEAEDMRREERAEELASMARLAEGKEAQLTADHLREQLKQALERETELRDGQGHLLTQSVASLTSQLSDKLEEIAELRRCADFATNAPRTPSKSRSRDDSDTLSTPVLRASRNIPESRKFTPTSHNRMSDYPPASPSVHPIQSLVTVSGASKPDTQLRSGVRDVQVLTQSVLREVQVASRSGRWFISGLFMMQLVIAMVWLLLTSGGGSVLADHPFVQSMMAFVDNTTPNVRFQS